MSRIGFRDSKIGQDEQDRLQNKQDRLQDEYIGCRTSCRTICKGSKTSRIGSRTTR